MRLIPTTSPRQLDLGLLVLRILTGVVLAAHGGQKLFVYGFAGVTGAFGQMGIPMPEIAGPAVALVEFFGGLALIVGLLTRLAGFGLAVNMLGALFLVHLKAGFFLPNGYEFVLTLFGATATLMLTGAGRYSLDALVTSRRSTFASEQPKQVRRAA